MKNTIINRPISKNKINLFQTEILVWFAASGRHFLPWRKSGLSPYKLVNAEVLLQRTKAETIEKFYGEFLRVFSSWNKIANSNISSLEEALHPVGLYKQRAKRLKNLAIEMVRLKGQFPSERAELEKIPFLGQYIVNAIELQVVDIASPLLDVNMAKLLERYFAERQLKDIRYDPYLQSLSREVVNHPASKQINWAILDFSAAVCKTIKPKCQMCPLIKNCDYYRQHKNMIIK